MSFIFDTRDVEPPVPTEASQGRRTGGGENLWAGFDLTLSSGPLLISNEYNLGYARRERYEQVERVSGKPLEETLAPFMPAPGPVPAGAPRREDVAIDRWLDTIPERQRAGIVASAMLQARADELARDRMAQDATVMSRARGGWEAAAGFAGIAGGYMADPLNIVGLAFGAPLAAGVLRTMATEAAIVGGTQAVVSTLTDADRERRGLPAGPGQTLQDAGLAALGGAAGGLLIKGIPLAWRAARRSMSAQEAAAFDTAQAFDDLMHANPFDGAAGRAEHQWRARQVDEALVNGSPMPDFQDVTRFRRDLMNSTALPEWTPDEAFHLPAEFPDAAAADALPPRSMIAAVPDGAEASRRFATEAEALAVAGRARKRSGLDLVPVELDDGTFALTRETAAVPMRRPDGTPLTFETERAARRFVDNAAVTKGRDLEVVPYAQDGGPRRFAIVEGATPEDIAAMRADPHLTSFAAGPDNSAGSAAGLRALERADNLNALAEALRGLPAAADRATGRWAAGFADAVELAAHAVRRGEDPSLALEGLGRTGAAADAPPRWRFDNSGDRPVVTLRGDELAAIDADLKSLRAAARDIYRQLREDGPARHPELGEIHFTAKGWRKLQSNSADRRTLQLVPALRDLVERATHIGSKETSYIRQDGMVRFHWVEAPVRLGNEDLRVGIQIAEDAQGRRFYNLNQDIEDWALRQKDKAPAESTRRSNVELSSGASEGAALQGNIGLSAGTGKVGAVAREGLRREAEADLVRFDRPGGDGTQSQVRSLAADLGREIQREGDFDVPLELDVGGEGVRMVRASDLLRESLDDKSFLETLKGCFR